MCVCVCVCVVFSLLARTLGEYLLMLFFFFFFFSHLEEISSQSHTQIPLFRPGSVHSGSAS